jgi:hypothetical protein
MRWLRAVKNDPRQLIEPPRKLRGTVELIRRLPHKRRNALREMLQELPSRKQGVLPLLKVRTWLIRNLFREARRIYEYRAKKLIEGME